jgi:hypothetical protein
MDNVKRDMGKRFIIDSVIMMLVNRLMNKNIVIGNKGDIKEGICYKEKRVNLKTFHFGVDKAIYDLSREVINSVLEGINNLGVNGKDCMIDEVIMNISIEKDILYLGSNELVIYIKEQ